MFRVLGVVYGVGWVGAEVEVRVGLDARAMIPSNSRYAFDEFAAYQHLVWDYRSKVEYGGRDPRLT